MHFGVGLLGCDLMLFLCMFLWPDGWRHSLRVPSRLFMLFWLTPGLPSSSMWFPLLVDWDGLAPLVWLKYQIIFFYGESNNQPQTLCGCRDPPLFQGFSFREGVCRESQSWQIRESSWWPCDWCTNKTIQADYKIQTYLIKGVEHFFPKLRIVGEETVDYKG